MERLEKAVERLETVCQGPGMCGDSSAKGEAQSTSELAQGTLRESWGQEGTGGEARLAAAQAWGGCGCCPVKIKIRCLQHFLGSGPNLLQVGGAARGCGSPWGAPADPCALFFSPGVAQYVQAFDALLAGPVAEYIKISKEVGGDVQKHVRTRVPLCSRGAASPWGCKGQICCQSVHSCSTASQDPSNP